MNLKKAKENRKNFLAPYLEKFKIAETDLKNLDVERAVIESNKRKIGMVETEKRRAEFNKKQTAIIKKANAIKKKKAKMISDLIALEPSHLSEPWIIKEVISWLRDRNYEDFVENAFIKAPKKAVMTEGDRYRAARDIFVMDAIDKIIEETGSSIREACKILVNRLYETDKKKYFLWDLTDPDQDLEKSIRQVYNNAKKKKAHKHHPPWPYYGRDIEVDENGNSTIFLGR